MDNFNVWISNTIIDISFSTYPGGEEFVRLNDFENGAEIDEHYEVKIYARLYGSSDVMRLLMLNDALQRVGFWDISVTIPYLPYARQDRVCSPGESFSLKVFARLINDAGFSKVTFWDQHSIVSSALIDNATNIPLHDLIPFNCELRSSKANTTVVIPDLGAVKRATLVANLLEVDTLQASKIRDTKTGRIVGTELYHHLDPTEDLPDNIYLIVDDICDGGRTFIELAKVLREYGARRVELLVTHGIFSKGLEVFDGLIDHIWTTHSFCQLEENDKLSYID